MPTRHRGPASETRPLNAYICLMRAAAAVTDRTSPPMREAGLSASQFGALEALLHAGPMHQTELARRLLKTGGNIVTVVRNLERDGLVSRVGDPGDKRSNLVSLTAKGRALVRQVFPSVLAAIVREFAVLAPREQESLRALCRRLGKGRE